jgi:hypothetical protein
MEKIALLFLTFFIVACSNEPINENSGETGDKKTNQQIVGSWRCVETGYSPGDKYIVETVPAIPPQTVTFRDDFTMSSTNMALEKFKFYRILPDSTIKRDVIAFLEEDPGMKTLNLADLNTTYSILWDENDLVLNFRWCIEGCHLKFKKIEKAE